MKDISEIEMCPACDAAHPVERRPRICRNLLALAGGIAEYLSADDEQASAEELLAICEDILGVSDDDDDEVFV